MPQHLFPRCFYCVLWLCQRCVQANKEPTIRKKFPLNSFDKQDWYRANTSVTWKDASLQSYLTNTTCRRYNKSLITLRGNDNWLTNKQIPYNLLWSNGILRSYLTTRVYMFYFLFIYKCSYLSIKYFTKRLPNSIFKCN